MGMLSIFSFVVHIQDPRMPAHLDRIPHQEVYCHALITITSGREICPCQLPSLWVNDVKGILLFSKMCKYSILALPTLCSSPKASFLSCLFIFTYLSCAFHFTSDVYLLGSLLFNSRELCKSTFCTRFCEAFIRPLHKLS